MPSIVDLSLARIEEARRIVSPVFLESPQYADRQLDAALGRSVVVKVETTNPLRSFKGRGADYLMSQIAAGPRVVCSSTGNFGQAIAYAGARRDLLEAMELAAQTLGLLLEPSGAAGLAAIRVHALPGERLATVLTGSNLRPEHLRMLGHSQVMNERLDAT